jgi:hypothetical protein
MGVFGKSAAQILDFRTEGEEVVMKKLVAAMVLVGTLSMASGAMAYDGGKKHGEHRGRSPELGIWFRFPQPRSRLDGRRREWGREKERERGRWEDHRRDRCGRPRPRHRT